MRVRRLEKPSHAFEKVHKIKTKRLFPVGLHFDIIFNIYLSREYYTDLNSTPPNAWSFLCLSMCDRRIVGRHEDFLRVQGKTSQQPFAIIREASSFDRGAFRSHFTQHCIRRAWIASHLPSLVEIAIVGEDVSFLGCFWPSRIRVFIKFWTS